MLTAPKVISVHRLVVFNYFYCVLLVSSIDVLVREKETLLSQLSDGQLELHRSSGLQADWFQQQRTLADTQRRAAVAEQCLANTRDDLLLAQAQVARLRSLLEPSHTLPSASIGRYVLLDMGTQRQHSTNENDSNIPIEGEIHLRREAVLFSAEAAVASSLYSAILLFRQLQQKLGENTLHSSEASVLCEAALSVVRAVALGWQSAVVMGGKCEAVRPEEWEVEVAALFTSLRDLLVDLLSCFQTSKEAPPGSSISGVNGWVSELRCGAVQLLKQITACEKQMGQVESEVDEMNGSQSVVAMTQVLSLSLSVKHQLFLHAESNELTGDEDKDNVPDENLAGETESLLQALDSSLDR